MKSWPRQWGLCRWRAPYGRYIWVWYSPMLVWHLLDPPGLSGLMTSTSWTHAYGTSKQFCLRVKPFVVFAWTANAFPWIPNNYYCFSTSTCEHFDVNTQFLPWIVTWWPNRETFVPWKFCTIRYISKAIIIQRSWWADKEEAYHGQYNVPLKQSACYQIRTYVPIWLVVTS